MPATVEASRLQEISDGLHKRSKVLLVVVIVVAAVFGVAYLSRSSTKAAVELPPTSAPGTSTTPPVTLVDINGDQEADYVIYGGSIVPGPPPPTMQPSKDVMKDHVIPIVVPLLTALIGAAGASFAAGRKLKGEMTKAAAAPKDS